MTSALDADLAAAARRLTGDAQYQLLSRLRDIYMERAYAHERAYNEIRVSQGLQPITDETVTAMKSNHNTEGHHE